MVQIFGRKESLRVQFALLTAEHEGVPVEHVHVDPASGEGADAEPFKTAFPAGKIPTLIDGDNKFFEVIAVTSYLASVNHSATASASLLETAKNAVGLGKPSLLGATVAEKASVLQWLSFINQELAPAMGSWFRPLIGKSPYNKKHVDDAAALTKKNLQILEQYLVNNTFLVSERITLADLFLLTTVQRGNAFVFDSAFRAQFPAVFRHFNTVARLPAAVKVCFNGQEPTFIDNAVTYTPPAKAPKAEKPAAEKKPAEPKADKKAAKKDDDEEEDDAPKEPKAKHPLESLGAPKSFPLDEWKRQYSNLDTPDALKWFDEHYDNQEYSLWRSVYKYPEELTLVFMSSNLITGFHSRLEGSRKYIFGNSAVYGANNDSKIQGVYLIRGSDHKSAFDVAPDWESYDFSPLDWAKPEDRKLVEDVWKWEGDFDGKPLADAKTFK